MSKTKRMVLDVIAQLLYICLTFGGLYIATKPDVHFVFRLAGVFIVLETISRYVVLYIQIKSEKEIEKYKDKYVEELKKYKSDLLKDIENQSKEDQDKKDK